MVDSYDIGDMVTITGLFMDGDGAPADPSSVTLTVKSPDGTITSLPASSDTVGTWSGSIEPNKEGVWRFRWQGTGAVTAAEEGAFVVRKQRVGL